MPTLVTIGHFYFGLTNYEKILYKYFVYVKITITKKG